MSPPSSDRFQIKYGREPSTAFLPSVASISFIPEAECGSFTLLEAAPDHNEDRAWTARDVKRAGAEMAASKKQAEGAGSDWFWGSKIAHWKIAAGRGEKSLEEVLAVVQDEKLCAASGPQTSKLRQPGCF